MNGGLCLELNQIPPTVYAGLEDAIRFLRSIPRSSLNDPKAPINAPETGDETESGLASPIAPRSTRDQPKGFSQLNRSNCKELEAHWGFLDPVQQRRIRAVERKPELYPKRFCQPDYLPQSCILLLSEGWPSAERYACCGIRNRGNPTGHCKLHKYCPACCWRERHTRQLMYVPAFDNGTWFWFTGSFQGELAVDPVAPSGSADEWQRYWDAYKAALVSWVERQSVRGVFWTEELAVNDLLDMRILPHVHCILEADDIGEEELQQFSADLEQRLLGMLGTDYLKPDLELKPIATARSLMNRIGYMIKPFNILTPYRKDWDQEGCHYDRHLAQRLNNNATEMVNAYSSASNNRKKLNFKGNLDSKTKGYIGISTDDLDDYREELARIRAESTERYIEQQEITE